MDKKTTLFQALKFTLFSISAGVIQVVAFALFNDLIKLGYWPSYLIALVASVIWNFTFNRRFTFKSAANIPVAMTKVFLFYLVFTPASTYLGHLAESAGVHDYIVLISTMLCNFVLEFLFCKLFVYKNQENTLEEKTK